MKNTLFILLSFFTLLTGAGVVFARNAIHSSLALILSLFGLASIYVLWGADFIAMIQVLIYTGAIVVLFVFVVMLLDLERLGSKLFSFGTILITLTASSVWCLTFLLLRVLNLAPSVSTGKTPPTLREVALLLFRDFLWPFEVLSVFLLALIVAVFALTHQKDEVAP